MAAPVLRPLGIGEILDVSLKIAWRNLGTLVRIVLVVVAPAQAVIAIVYMSAIPDYHPQAGGFPSTENQLEADEVWTFAAASLAAVVIGFLASQFATGACFRVIAESYLGRETDWRTSLGFAFRRFRSILWIVVLGGVLTGIGFLFCVIPGVYLAVAFALAMPVLMSEGQRGSKALGRSRALVRGRWWKTFLTLVVGGVLATIFSGLVSGVVVALAFAGGDQPVAIFFITALGGIAGALVSTPFSAAYHTVLYFDLRVRKEAFDLQLLSSRLGVEPPAGWEPAPAYPADAAAKPPFWPPPPGWTPPPAAPPSSEPGPPSAPEPAPDTDSEQPPFWPPPPGSKAPE